MPFVDRSKVLVVDREYLVSSGLVARLDALNEKHELGAKIGSRAYEEWGADETYTLALDISFDERENLASQQKMNVRLPNSYARQALQGSADLPEGDINLITEENNTRAETKLRLLMTWVKGWSHYTGKPKPGDFKELTSLTAFVLLYVISDLTKGQAIKSDSPLSTKSTALSEDSGAA